MRACFYNRWDAWPMVSLSQMMRDTRVWRRLCSDLAQVPQLQKLTTLAGQQDLLEGIVDDPRIQRTLSKQTCFEFNHWPSDARKRNFGSHQFQCISVHTLIKLPDVATATWLEAKPLVVFQLGGCEHSLYHSVESGPSISVASIPNSVFEVRILTLFETCRRYLRV